LEAACHSGILYDFAMIRIEVPRAAPLTEIQSTLADAGEGTEADTTAYESCTDGGTLDTDEGIDENAAAAPDACWPDACWPDTDDGF